MNLLIEISRCKNIESLYNSKESKHPCTKVISAQKTNRMNNLQVPEPWSGNIKSAPLLFITPNPLITYEEDYPLFKWSDEFITDFFTNRFSGGKKRWVKDGLYPLKNNGTYKNEWNRIWASLKDRAMELYDAFDIRPGLDYAITYAVHCRTLKCYGLKEALIECVNNYLRKVIFNSGASIIVAMGEIACSSVYQELTIDNKPNTYGPILFEGAERVFTFLPHPTKWGPRSFGETINKDELFRLKDYLSKNT